MSGKEIVDIVVTTSLFGWIPIYGFFCGIAKVINAIKGNDKFACVANIGTSNAAKSEDEEEYVENDKSKQDIYFDVNE